VKHNNYLFSYNYYDTSSRQPIPTILLIDRCIGSSNHPDTTSIPTMSDDEVILINRIEEDPNEMESTEVGDFTAAEPAAAPVREAATTENSAVVTALQVQDTTATELAAAVQEAVQDGDQVAAGSVGALRDTAADVAHDAVVQDTPTRRSQRQKAKVDQRRGAADVAIQDAAAADVAIQDAAAADEVGTNRRRTRNEAGEATQDAAADTVPSKRARNEAGEATEDAEADTVASKRRKKNKKADATIQGAAADTVLATKSGRRKKTAEAAIQDAAGNTAATISKKRKQTADEAIQDAVQHQETAVEPLEAVEAVPQGFGDSVSERRKTSKRKCVVEAINNSRNPKIKKPKNQKKKKDKADEQQEKAGDDTLLQDEEANDDKQQAETNADDLLDDSSESGSDNEDEQQGEHDNEELFDRFSDMNENSEDDENYVAPEEDIEEDEEESGEGDLTEDDYRVIEEKQVVPEDDEESIAEEILFDADEFMKEDIISQDLILSSTTYALKVNFLPLSFFIHMAGNFLVCKFITSLNISVFLKTSKLQ
jgi:hypothetical protein